MENVLDQLIGSFEEIADFYNNEEAKKMVASLKQKRLREQLSESKEDSVR